MTRLHHLRADSPPATESAQLARFLLIGQSNMAGRGKVEDEELEPLAGVWKLNRDGRWVAAIEPLHFDKPDRAGVGPGRSFARTLRRANSRVEIGLIPCAVGSTSLDDWRADGELFNLALMRTLQSAGDGPFCGVLWHQGEHDAQVAELAGTYAGRWKLMITALRNALGASTVPVIVGGLGGYLSKWKDERFKFAPEVNRQLASVACRSDNIGWVDATDLVDGGDGLHFSSASQRELGRRYAWAFLDLVPDWRAQTLEGLGA